MDSTQAGEVAQGVDAERRLEVKRLVNGEGSDARLVTKIRQKGN